LYRLQYLTIAAGFFIPLALSIFSLANIKITQQRDLSPFSLAIGNLIVAWGLFRYGLFDIVPIARERIVENMSDPVIVLDNQNRIVDINAAALEMIKKPGAEVIGRNSSVAFAKWPMVVELLENFGEQRKEVSTKYEDDMLFFDISLSPIVNQRQELIGRILVARDITRHKTLEVGYRMLSAELEQRVAERTKELQASAARYRAVVENQTEFIVRWKPDGTRTFVNEAYCRYFDITFEQAISSSFISQVVSEDRAAIEEKISRLKSGAVNGETDIHRVMKPDGSIGWQEWTDSVIRSESGQVVELQSVGRDITERKLAEEAVRESEALYRKAIEVAGAVPYRQSYPSEEFHIDYDFIGEGIRQITGYGPEEFSESLWDSLVQESHLAGELAQYSWREAIQRVRTGASPIWQCEHRILTRNGETRWIYEAAVELRDKAGISHGSIGLYQNISERKRAEENLAEAYDTTLEGWAKALELRDKETEGHSRRVTETTLALARTMGFSEQELLHIRRGSILHDIGKMGIPDDILRKHGPLTDEERTIVQKHPDTAHELLKRIPYLEKSLEIPYCHHEKWDGTGYPRGLKGEEIPLAARVFAVVDVWDALSTDRPYRNAWNKEQVAEYLMHESGKHFDPRVVNAFLASVEKGEI
jgi:PAS domain S-box-containing protein